MRKILRDVYFLLKYILRYPNNCLKHNNVSYTTKIANDVSLNFCKIGKYNYIARRCSLFNVEMGNYCCIGPDVHIGGMEHSYWWYSMSPILSNQNTPSKTTLIEHDVWIGAKCVIKQGVHIGTGAVIGANSFVNKDVEPFSIVVGSPAKFLKYRFGENVQNTIMATTYWNVCPKEAIKKLQNLKSI